MSCPFVLSLTAAMMRKGREVSNRSNESEPCLQEKVAELREGEEKGKLDPSPSSSECRSMQA